MFVPHKALLEEMDKTFYIDCDKAQGWMGIILFSLEEYGGLSNMMFLKLMVGFFSFDE